MTSRRGFILMDAIGSLVIVMILAAVLAVSVAQHSKALRNVERSREALAIAERAMADLQTGGKPAGADPLTRIEVVPLTDTPAPEGRAWVRVSVKHHRGGAELTGMVPRKTGEVKP